MKYRKKPVIVEATQWFKNGDHPDDGPTCEEGQVVRRFHHPDISGGKYCEKCHMQMHAHGWVDTLEGSHIVCPGDWIVTGVEGERYPCKPSIFAKTYEAVQ